MPITRQHFEHLATACSETILSLRCEYDEDPVAEEIVMENIIHFCKHFNSDRFDESRFRKAVENQVNKLGDYS